MRKKVLAVVLAVLAFSLIAASAATLGGITVNGQVGADVEAVTSCDDTGVTVDFTTTFSGGAYVVDSVTVGGIHDDCDGQTLDITLSGTVGGVLFTSTAAVADNGAGIDDNTVQFSGLAVDAEDLDSVAIAITG